MTSTGRGETMIFMRALVLAALLFVVPHAAAGQAVRVLHIKVSVIDDERKTTPVPHYMLLLSDNPASAPPRRIVTALDGTADVTLRPGSYTVESDQPVAFQRKSYLWTQMVTIVAGRDAVLELTAQNAEVQAVTSASPLASDPSFLLPQWQDSVVAIWTPTARASGFVVDAKGLIATSQRAIGAATSVEVQMTSTVKVAASVLAADPVRDVAVLWIDPTVVAAARPVPLECVRAAELVIEDGQELFAIGAPLREQKGMTSGTVSRVEPHAIAADFILASGGAGGPVFTAGGRVVGITTLVDGSDERSGGRSGDVRVIRIGDACDAVASAEKKMTAAMLPSGAHRPVEPARPFPIDALKDAAQRRAGSASPYQMSSSDFDIAFITPVLIYAAQMEAEQASERERRGGAPTPLAEEALTRPLTDFGAWSGYVNNSPPVLLIRVTPKLVEGFWTTVARGAARTQGLSLPPIKHVKSGFSWMRAFCGGTEVTPIHPFKLERPVSGGEAIYEGLYAFDPGALGPECGTVALVLYSDKTPENGDRRVVDPVVVQKMWQDFAPYRALAASQR